MCVSMNVFALAYAYMYVHVCPYVPVRSMLHEYVSGVSLLMCVHFCVLYVLTCSYICADFC